MEKSAALPAPFHPLIAEWFRSRYDTPTEIQQLSWPVIASGGHALVTAPTGSGKTLTAFLWALNQLISGQWPAGQLNVLYVSPLKALGNDVRRNLLEPLRELEELFRHRGEEFPQIMVRTRSGDTPQSERRAMLRRPPEILITTPESLAILLTSRGGRSLFGSLQTCILDEIHSVVGSKRGVFLISSVERIAAEWGEFQRIALTATVRPAETVADFVGGFRLEEGPEGPVYHRREVSLCRAVGTKEYRLQILSPEDEAGYSSPLEDGAEASGGLASREAALSPGGAAASENGMSPGGEELWRRIARQIAALTAVRRSTLIFANSRRLVEKLARLINEEAGERIAYAHHGSLSRELRLSVEQRLKKGELRAITATNSLELGIDIGSLDLVVMVQTPFTISSGIQKLGRAGHTVGSISEGVLFPSHGLDYLKAAVMAEMVPAADLEEIRPLHAPLDVLAQLILSMTVVRPWNLDRLYNRIRTAEPFRQLPRRHFDLVVEMLAGKYAGTRIRELQPRLSVDRSTGTAEARKGTPYLLYLSGGTIPDRGHYTMRLTENGSRVGELDEEFVWERKIGDRFELGTQTWEIERITHNDVFVRPTGAAPNIIPFWRAEERNRDAHFSAAILRFLDRLQALETAGRGDELSALLQRDHAMSSRAAGYLINFLRSQREATAAPLPGLRRLIAEHIDRPFGPEGLRQVVLHSLRGGQVNRPLALLLEANWRRRRGAPPQIIAANDAVVLALPEDEPLAPHLRALAAEPLEELLRESLEQTGLFGALFRENAGRSLLLPKQSFSTRQPLWFNRLRAKKLLQTVFDMEDFPVLLETWRSCLRDIFDLEALQELLDALAGGEIEIHEPHTAAPSPLCSGIIWRQINTYMYADDTPQQSGASGLDRDLWSSVINSARLRPRVAAELCAAFRQKLQRLAPGYAPDSSAELLEWVKERLLLPEAEWRELTAAVLRDGGPDESIWRREIGTRLLHITLPGREAGWIIALDQLSILRPLLPGAAEVRELSGAASEADGIRSTSPPQEDAAGEDGPELTGALAWFLRFYPPLTVGELYRLLPFPQDELAIAAEELIEAGTLIRGELTAGALETSRPSRTPGAAAEPAGTSGTAAASPDARAGTGSTASEQLCDRENLEILLRMQRRAGRPSFEPLPPEALTPLLARLQGLLPRGEEPGELLSRLERLIGLVMPAEALEERLLPARMIRYYRGMLDSLAGEEDLRWFGAGHRMIILSYPEELELYLPDTGSGHDRDTLRIFPSARGRYSFFELKEQSGADAASLAEKLWQLVWQGRAANDSFAALRSGISAGFTVDRSGGAAERKDAQSGGSSLRPARRGSRSGFRRWKSSLPLSGNWYPLGPEGDENGAAGTSWTEETEALKHTAGETGDPYEEEELRRDRIRQLLSRYGILARPLLNRELPALQWRPLLRTMQRMELSGELVSGHFIRGLAGLQFISPEALELLQSEQQKPAEEQIYWMNAADPASPCGLGLEGLPFDLPERAVSNYVVFHGRRPVLILRRNGKELHFAVEPGGAVIQEYLGIFTDICTRDVRPPRRFLAERINGIAAAESPYREDLEKAGFVSSYKGLVFRPRPGV
jgi:ATP-dependent Lhr-like helicase